MPVHKTKGGGYQWGNSGMEEIWKDIPGYEGFYQVSNMGRVKHLVEWRGNDYSARYISNPKIVLPHLDCNGYERIRLFMWGKGKPYRIHRLVAKAFIPNPNNYPQINHIDEDKTNNRVDNLEWCTQTYNNKYGTRGQRIGITNHNGKGAKRSVLQYDLDGNFIQRWKSMQDAADNLPGVSSSKICECCRGNRPHHRGFMWKYEFPDERKK